MPLSELIEMTDRQLWDIWIEPSIREQKEESRHGNETSSPDVASSSGEDSYRSGKASAGFLRVNQDETVIEPDGTTVIRDRRSRDGKFAWRIPKAKRPTECRINDVPVEGEAILENFAIAGLLKREDVERVKRERREALERLAAAAEKGGQQ